MYCPTCRSEFRKGISECANCMVVLVDGLPDEDPYSSPEKMADLLKDKDLQAIVVGSFPHVRESQTELADLRIATLIAPEDPEQEIQPGVHTRLYLLVSTNDLPAVRDHFNHKFQRGLQTEGLMLKRPDGDADRPDQNSEAMLCPACGTTVPETSSECPECGLVVGEA